MNPKRPASHSYKKKLMIAFLAIGLLPLVIISIVYQNILSNRIMEENENTSIEKLRYISLNIEKQMESTEQLLGWITYNQRLEDLLTASWERPCDQQLAVIQFSSYVTEYAINARIEQNISKILIVSEDGYSFQMGGGYSLLDQEAIMNHGWMEKFYGLRADQLILSEDVYLKDSFVFPLSSRIYQNSLGAPIGWCLIVFHNDMYSRHLTSGNPDESLFLINQDGQCIGHSTPALTGSDMSADPLIRQILESTEEFGHVLGIYQEESSILHYYRIPSTNMVEIKAVPLEAFLRENRRMTQVSVFFIFSTMIVIFIVIFYLRNKLVKPINTINDYIKGVPASEFQGNMVFDGDDEFRSIADSINTMEYEIKKLMEQQQRESEIKKDLEFKVLQNQINPHFLYNTLNSIKWMAALQHADTIRDMTAALGRLLQNIAKGTESKIPIYEEMSLLDDYVMIQDIRYDGKIKVNYHIGDGQITQAYIIKFMFQPIVENAIFHGIEPNGGGTIDIFLKHLNDGIYIHIIDDGIGMTEEQISSLLCPGSDEKNLRGLNGIGVSNIQQRIQMTYGPEYGITITSELGEYTDVTIKIPYEKEGLL